MIQVHTTLQKILNNCNDWIKICNEQGWDEYSVKMGGGDVEVTLSIEDARRYGLIKTDYMELK